MIKEIFIGIIVIMILWSLIERKLLGTTKFTISSAKLPKKLDGVSFVVLADLHDCTFGPGNIRLLRKINRLSPDFIIAAGDIINKNKPCFPGNAYYLLEQLSKKYKVFFAYGNHEQRMEAYGKEEASLTEEQAKLYTAWNQFKKRLIKLNISILDNKGLRYGTEGVWLNITGVSIGPEYFARNKVVNMEEGYLKSLVETSDKSHYQILIAHNPVYFENYVAWGADLTIAGHVHGGMVRLPGLGGVISPQAKFFPKYQAGKYAKNHKEMVVSRGLGSHSIMPRLFNIPELVFITLKSQ